MRYDDPLNRSTDHVFGFPGAEGLVAGERLCNEPVISGVHYDRIYHIHFDMLEDGNAECRHCGEMFIDALNLPTS